MSADLAPWMTGTGCGPNGRAVDSRTAEVEHRRAEQARNGGPFRSRRCGWPVRYCADQHRAAVARKAAAKVAERTCIKCGGSAGPFAADEYAVSGMCGPCLWGDALPMGYEAAEASL